MEVTCPKCGAKIAPAGINVAKDVAYCAVCAEGYALSELADSTPEAMLAVDIDNPPDGCWFEMRPTGFEVGSTARSGIGVFLLVFSLAWNSIVAAFVVAAAMGLIKGKGVAAGGLFPGVLFLIPFVLIGLATGGVGLLSLLGRIVVTVDNDDATIFTGICSVGWRRRFAWSDVQSVSETATPVDADTESQRQIRLDGTQRRHFGALLSDARRHYVAAFLQRALRPRS